MRDNDSLWNYNPKDKSITLIQRADSIIGPFDFYQETAFWSDSNASKILSTDNRYGNGTPRNPDIIFDEFRFQVQAMAVDYFNEKVYAIDKTTGTAIVIDFRTKQYGILFTDLDQPRDILVDPAEGLMFILQSTNSVKLRFYYKLPKNILYIEK